MNSSSTPEVLNQWGAARFQFRGTKSAIANCLAGGYKISVKIKVVPLRTVVQFSSLTKGGGKRRDFHELESVRDLKPCSTHYRFRAKSTNSHLYRNMYRHYRSWVVKTICNCLSSIFLLTFLVITNRLIS